MRSRSAAVLLALVIASVSAACDARPQAPEFTETTTTSTTLPTGSTATTTTPTLPPEEERVVGIVEEVVDGDTLTVVIDGTPTPVRLLGINAPERTECWGNEATAALSGLVLGRQVSLVAGDEDLDSFGRALRFVYVDDGTDVEFINSILVEDGDALAIQNGNAFEESLKAEEARAYQSGRGMWATFACGDDEGVTADRPVMRVQELNYDPEGPDDQALDQEYVTIVNEGYGRVAISGWVLRDESSTNRLTFPRMTLEVGDSVTVVTGCDGGPADAIHWCSDTPVWSNEGDTAIVTDTLGNVVIWYTYTGSDG
jgi:endonuclease YncB( thermonuclease family)